MNTTNRRRRFSQAHFAQKLGVPEGITYVDGSTIEDISASLREGLAVFGQGCDGKVFVWPSKDGYEADHFFFGPPTAHHFDSVEAAADFAAGLCE